MRAKDYVLTLVYLLAGMSVRFSASLDTSYLAVETCNYRMALVTNLSYSADITRLTCPNEVSLMKSQQFPIAPDAF